MHGARVTAPALAGLATAGAASATVLFAGTARAQIEAVRDSGAPTDPASVLLALAAAAATLVAARLVVCAAASGVALLARRAGSPSAAAARIAVATSPRSMRPAMAALLAGGVALAVAAPATATPVGVASVVAAAPAHNTPGPIADPARHLPAPGWQSLPEPGWLPLRPARPRPAAQQAPGALVQLVSSGATRGGGADHELVVRRGDTLWALAARALGPGASAAEVAAEWPRWWQSNKAAIGADPDLLVPGTRLTAPAPLAHTTITEGS